MIITLPISPRNAPTIGYWLTPVAGDMLRRRRGKDNYRIIVGALGAHEPRVEDVTRFQQTLDALGVKGDIVLDAAYAEDFYGCATRLLECSAVKMTPEECYVCSCGALELPCSQARYLKQKTFKIDASGEMYCARCGEKAARQTIKRTYILFKRAAIRQALNDVRVVPEFYRTEFSDLAEQIAVNGICISRNRETAFCFAGTYLDVEFVWETLLCIQEEASITLVVNNHVLRQALIAVLALHALGVKKDVTILVLPYLRLPGEGGAGKWTVDRLMRLGHDAYTIRFMLGVSLHWNRKDCEMRTEISQVEYRRFQLLKGLLKEIVRSGDGSASSFCNELNQDSLTQGLKHVFNPEKFDYRKLCGLW